MSPDGGEQVVPAHSLDFHENGRLNLTVKLPGVTTAADMDVLLSANHITVHVQGRYKLELPLAVTIHDKADSIKFVKKKATLKAQFTIVPDAAYFSGGGTTSPSLSLDNDGVAEQTCSGQQPIKLVTPIALSAADAPSQAGWFATLGFRDLSSAAPADSTPAGAPSSAGSFATADASRPAPRGNGSAAAGGDVSASAATSESATLGRTAPPGNGVAPAAGGVPASPVGTSQAAFAGQTGPPGNDRHSGAPAFAKGCSNPSTHDGARPVPRSKKGRVPAHGGQNSSAQRPSGSASASAGPATARSASNATAGTSAQPATSAPPSSTPRGAQGNPPGSHSGPSQPQSHPPAEAPHNVHSNAQFSPGSAQQPDHSSSSSSSGTGAAGADKAPGPSWAMRLDICAANLISLLPGAYVQLVCTVCWALLRCVCFLAILALHPAHAASRLLVLLPALLGAKGFALAMHARLAHPVVWWALLVPAAAAQTWLLLLLLRQCMAVVGVVLSLLLDLMSLAVATVKAMLLGVVHGVPVLFRTATVMCFSHQTAVGVICAYLLHHSEQFQGVKLFPLLLAVYGRGWVVYGVCAVLLFLLLRQLARHAELQRVHGLAALLVCCSAQTLRWYWAPLWLPLMAALWLLGCAMLGPYHLADGNTEASLKPETVRGAAGEIARILQCTDYYQVLGVPRDADDAALRKAKRDKWLLTHPDKMGQAPGAKEAVQRVNKASEVLSDSASRREYDAALLGGASASDQARTGYEPSTMDYPCKCGQTHNCNSVDRSLHAARWCGTCQDYHPTQDGDIWTEASMVVFVRAFMCNQGLIFDITDLARCIGILRRCEPNAHNVLFNWQAQATAAAGHGPRNSKAKHRRRKH